MDAKCALKRDRTSLILFYPKVSIFFYLFTSNKGVFITNITNSFSRKMSPITLRQKLSRHVYPRKKSQIGITHATRFEISSINLGSHKRSVEPLI